MHEDLNRGIVYAENVSSPHRKRNQKRKERFPMRPCLKKMLPPLRDHQRGGILKFSKQEKVLSTLVYASGLPAFVMSQLPLIFDPNKEYFLDPGIYPNLVMPIVLGTVLFAALTAPTLAKSLLKYDS